MPVCITRAAPECHLRLGHTHTGCGYPVGDTVLDVVVCLLPSGWGWMAYICNRDDPDFFPPSGGSLTTFFEWWL